MQSQPTPPAWRRYGVLALKLLITVGGLAWVINQISLQAVAERMRNAAPGWLLLAFLLMIASLQVRAVRWWLLLRGLDVSTNLRKLTALYFVGNFFNAFLPSGFGGDVVRAVAAGRTVSGEVAAATVIIDRLTGLLMLFLLALLALPMRPPAFPDSWLLLLLVVAGGGLLGGALLLHGGLLRLIGRYSEQLSNRSSLWQMVHKRLWPVADAVQQIGHRAMLQALAVSLLFNLMLVGWWYAIARGLHLNISYAYLLLAVPVLSLALLVPSIGGLGVRETLAPLLFAGVVSAEAAVALSLSEVVLLRLTSLLGAPVFIFTSAGRGAKQPAQSLTHEDAGD